MKCSPLSFREEDALTKVLQVNRRNPAPKDYHGHMYLQPWDGSEIMFIIVRTFKEFVTIDDKVY